MSKQETMARDEAQVNAMAEFVRLASPGERHRMLARLEGDWSARSRIWMAAEASETENEGSAEKRVIMGGRFVQERFISSFAGVPLEGLSLTGFNNHTQRFMTLWLDSAGTGMILSEGADFSDAGFSTLGSFCDPLSGATRRGRWVIRIEGPDRHVVEMFQLSEGGAEFRAMEITYQRK